MGAYINLGNFGFQRVRNSEYVDKSGLIAIVNGTLFTERSFSCVSRSRRFGKSVAAKMLCAYYDQSCDSRHLFTDLEIAHDPSFEKHLNKYPVIFLDMTNFTTRFKDDSIMKHVQKELKEDIHEAYPDIPVKDDDDLMAYLIRITDSTHQPFIFIIDEWDAICRDEENSTLMDEYVVWLRNLFKHYLSDQVFALVERATRNHNTLAAFSHECIQTKRQGSDDLGVGRDHRPQEGVPGRDRIEQDDRCQ